MNGKKNLSKRLISVLNLKVTNNFAKYEGNDKILMSGVK